MKKVLGILLIVLAAWVVSCHSGSRGSGGESPVVPMPSPPVSRDFPMVVDFASLPDGPINSPMNFGEVVLDGQNIEVQGGAITISGLGTLDVTSPADFRQAAVLVKEMNGYSNTTIEGLDAGGSLLTMTVTGAPGDYYYVRLIGQTDSIRTVRVSGQLAKVRKMIFARPFQTVDFSPWVSIPSNGNISKIAVADFNKDSNADIAVADSGLGDITIFEGNDKGKFRQSSVLSISAPAIDLEATDLNTDGFTDLLALRNNGLTVFLNNAGQLNKIGEYALGFPVYEMAIGDFNQDDLPDVAVAGQSGLYVLMNVGNGVFGAPQLLTAADVRAVAVNDMNGDSFQDIVIGEASPPTVQVWLGDGAGNFAFLGSNPLLSNPASLAAIQFDWDDYPDVAVLLNGSPNLQTFINDGSGTLWINQVFQATQGAAQQLVMADINNDGFADMVMSDATYDTLDIFVSDLVGNFIIADRENIGDTPTAIAVGDINDDRRADLIFNVASGKVWIYANTSH